MSDVTARCFSLSFVQVSVFGFLDSRRVGFSPRRVTFVGSACFCNFELHFRRRCSPGHFLLLWLLLLNFVAFVVPVRFVELSSQFLLSRVFNLFTAAARNSAFEQLVEIICGCKGSVLRRELLLSFWI